MQQRTARYALCVLLAALAGGAAGQAQYPAKPVRVIVPYPPGGGNDTLARLFGQKLTEAWGQQFVIENRPGAGTIIGTAAAAKSPADGYTLLLSSIATHAFSPHLYSKPGYDPVKDFSPITLLVIAPTVLAVNPALPVKSLKELIALAKKHPGSSSMRPRARGLPRTCWRKSSGAWRRSKSSTCRTKAARPQLRGPSAARHK
jgi:tripartite-type tricarboxylate transporter receptor subunit TctC